MATPNNGAGFNLAATRRRAVLDAIKTAVAMFLVGAGSFVVLHLVGFSLSVAVVLLSLSLVFPIITWWYSPVLVKKVARLRPPSTSNPQHMQVVRVVDQLLPKIGMHDVPVFISQMTAPNAFAAGRTPKSSFITVTEGLFDCNLTDEEMEGVLAHELGHVKHWDVTLNTIMAVMGSIFSIVLAQGFPRFFIDAYKSDDDGTLDKLSKKVRTDKEKFFLPTAGILGFLVTILLYWITRFFTRLMTLFVSRARESHADAFAAMATKNPCALSMALQKIVRYALTMPKDEASALLGNSLAPILFLSGEDLLPEGEHHHEIEVDCEDETADEDRPCGNCQGSCQPTDGEKKGCGGKCGGNCTCAEKPAGAKPPRRSFDNPDKPATRPPLTKGQRFSVWYSRLFQNHPPIPVRLNSLDEMSGGKCRRIKLRKNLPDLNGKPKDDLEIG